MERALRVLQGEGPQVPLEDFGRPYDHPYFSQIFLASVFGIIGYPDSVQGEMDADYAESLYLVPRVLMGIIAVVDTFLIYKISERRYNEGIAFTAAILFAVMPLSWLTRRLYIDPIQLPFILLAILFAVYMDKMCKNSSRNLVSIAVLSGLFLGLAIFTKISAICMIPLVGYLVFASSPIRNKKRSRHVLMSWSIPVVLVPGIWPAFAVLNGQFDNWINDLLWQAGREGGILDTFNSILTMDPVLVLVGLAGFAYAIILKREVFVLLWIIPFVVLFSFLISRMAITFWVPMLPVFCIAAGILIVGLVNTIRIRISENNMRSRSKISYYLKDRNIRSWKGSIVSFPKGQALVYPIVLSTIAVVGLFSTLILITSDLNTSYFELYRFIISQLPHTADSTNNTEVLMVGSAKLRSFAWIPEYVTTDGDYSFDYRASPLKESFQNKRVILLSDPGDFERYVQSEPEEYAEHKSLYNSTYPIREFKDKTNTFDRDEYPYTNMIENRGVGEIGVRVN